MPSFLFSDLISIGGFPARVALIFAPVAVVVVVGLVAATTVGPAALVATAAVPAVVVVVSFHEHHRTASFGNTVELFQALCELSAPAIRYSLGMSHISSNAFFSNLSSAFLKGFHSCFSSANTFLKEGTVRPFYFPGSLAHIASVIIISASTLGERA